MGNIAITAINVVLKALALNSYDPPFEVFYDAGSGNVYRLKKALDKIKRTELKIGRVSPNDKRIHTWHVAVDGETALHVSSQNGHVQCITLLLQYGADINAKDNQGNCVLYYAVRYGQKDAMLLLLQNKADVNSKNKIGETLLHIAVMYSRLELAKLLLIHGVDKSIRNTIGETSIHYCVTHNQMQILKFLLNQANCNLAIKNVDGYSPLHYAAKLGRTKMIDLLLDKGAKISDRSYDHTHGLAPIHISCLWGKTDSLLKLLERGADISSKDNDNNDALFWAMKMNQKDCENILSNLLDEDKKADIKKKIQEESNKTRRKSFDNDNDSSKNIVEDTNFYNSTRRRSFDKGQSMKELVSKVQDVNFDKPLNHFVKIKPNRRRGSFDEAATNNSRHTRRRSFG